MAELSEANTQVGEKNPQSRVRVTFNQVIYVNSGIK